MEDEEGVAPRDLKIVAKIYTQSDKMNQRGKSLTLNKEISSTNTYLNVGETFGTR